MGSRPIGYGVLGTSFIVPKFVAAAHAGGGLRLVALSSRRTATAHVFAERHALDEDVAFCTGLDELLERPDVELVHVASPNSLHAERAIACMERGRAVLVEKPIASNARELRSMRAAAKTNDVLMIEAMKSTPTPNFAALVEHLPRIGRLHHASAVYAKRSSRYDAYLAGESPRTFDPRFSNGATMDLGTYCIYPFITLFGPPSSVSASVRRLPSGVDGTASVVLDYPDFPATLAWSKTSTSFNRTEFQGELGTLVVEDVSSFRRIELVHPGGEREDLSRLQAANEMEHLAAHIARLLGEGRRQSDVLTHERSAAVLDVLDEIRRLGGVAYPADR